MICPNCGKEIADIAVVCVNCGTAIENEKSSTKQKKPIYKKWWFWLIIVFVALLFWVSVANSDTNSDGANTDESVVATAESTEEVTEKPTDKPTEAPTEAPTEDPAKVEEEFKNACDEIDFETLARNPEKYKGNKYKFTGQVIQVQEGWFDQVDLRVNITKEEYEYIDDVLWTDTIYATVEIPDGEDNILEDDVITFWGTCDGEYTYESVLGSNITLPKITIEYYEFNN